MDYLTSLASSTSGISCTSRSFQLGGAHVENIPGNTSQNLHNTICNNALYFSSIFTKFGIMPSGKSLWLYSRSYKNNTGLPGVFNYLSYITWEPLMVLSRNLYCTNITLVSRFFWIRFIHT